MGGLIKRPNNILIQKDTIKLADFGHSYLKGSDSNTEVWGVIPYVDPKAFDRKTPYKMNEKSDIYSLAVIFWELTSRSSPFNYKKIDHSSLTLNILNGLREKPISNTNNKFVALYEKCWQHEPDDRPNIQQVFSELAFINPENNEESTSFLRNDKYKETPLSCVSTGMVDEKAVLVALVCLPKGTQVNLPGKFKGYRVLIDYGKLDWLIVHVMMSLSLV
ncbi:unnamed protein product [Rhizophagus irregularis]|nr:unnamed protein product [Rhizophagus irregularis]